MNLSADGSDNSTNISYIIDSTILNQPAVWLTVESGTYKVEESRDRLLIGTSVYVVGYRCTSNPGKTCYISHEVSISILPSKSVCTCE